ncbi:MAG: hypothetical protein LBT23_04350 [Synergistaceae bacterium]|jgi:hypothetical protein|nr:hypothetical protein [Synergistaceae bacterium]
MMGDETIARLFDRLDALMDEMQRARERMVRVEEQLSTMRKELSDALTHVGSLRLEMANIKGKVAGAYFVGAACASILFFALTRADVIGRLFGN